jgi:hypothetical protein
MAATARNSLCQFWKDSNQNCEVLKYCQKVTAAPPWLSSWALYALAPPAAWRATDIKNNKKNRPASEFSYTFSTQPPWRTGQGAFAGSAALRGSSSCEAGSCPGS